MPASRVTPAGSQATGRRRGSPRGPLYPIFPSMKLSTLEAIFRALEDEAVRYLVAGGVAVNAHGYQRLTQDLDLVLDLEEENVLRAVRALAGLSYRPVLPVEAEDLADPEKRREWHEQRNVEVFSMLSDLYPGTAVDLFVREPFDFEREYSAAMVGRVASGLEVRFVRLATLIAMKEEADRPRDRDDTRHLRWIMEEGKEASDGE